MSRGSVGRSKLPTTATDKIETHLTVENLIALGIVASRQTAYYWICERGFPSGHLLGPGRRCWTVSEIQGWLKTRQTKKRAVSPNVGRPPKSRKHTTVEVVASAE